MRRLLLLLPLATLAFAPTAGGAGPVSTVTVKDIDFKPGVRRVSPGTTVTWSFQDEFTPHNVRPSGKPRFQGSGTKLFESTYSVRFTKRGSYKYVCTIHPGMVGKIVVR